MKRILALLLMLLMLIPVSFAVSADDDTEPGDDPLPSSFTLVGTPDLPPICDQGEIGCCVSAAATYMQFTNAVSKYIRNNIPGVTFEPAKGDAKNLFSAKWTYGFSGAATAPVYDFLKEQGCVTMDKSSFEMHPKSGRYMYHQWNRASKLKESAMKWDISGSEMEEAMNYRLANYDQVWIKDVFKVDGKVHITDGAEGQKLITRIKQSLVNGNVVVTGGISGGWTYHKGLTNTGTLAKSKDESALVLTVKGAGGHQVSIIGYDDEVSCRYKGVTMKGAFLVANSWGTSWMNDGCIWVMYDALNEVSEFPELNVEDRVITMDQFIFTDWKTDIIVGMPELYVEVDATADKKDAIIVQLVRKDKETGSTKLFTPYLYKSTSRYPSYLNDKEKETTGYKYLSIGGEVNGGATDVTFAHAYGELFIPEEGKKVSDYQYGVVVKPNNGEASLRAVRLKNKLGQVIAEIPLTEEEKSLSKFKYEFFFPETVCSVTVPTIEAGSGISMNGYTAYYLKGSEVKLDYALDEGYTDDAMTVTLSDGTVVKKNENGEFVVTVNGDTAMTVAGVEKVAEPSVSPEPSKGESSEIQPSVNSEKEKPSKTEKEEDDDATTIYVIIGVVAASVAVVAVVVVVIVVKKKKA